MHLNVWLLMVIVALTLALLCGPPALQASALTAIDSSVHELSIQRPEMLQPKVPQDRVKPTRILSQPPRTKRKRTTPYQAKTIASRQGWRCDSCNTLLSADFEIDHRVPLFLGGTNDMSNLTAKCRACHKMKSSLEQQYTRR